MLFNSYAFLFFFLPIVVAAYYALPAHRLRLLLAAGRCRPSGTSFATASSCRSSRT
jgi:hypothetical protein